MKPELVVKMKDGTIGNLDLLKIDMMGHPIIPSVGHLLTFPSFTAEVKEVIWDFVNARIVVGADQVF